MKDTKVEVKVIRKKLFEDDVLVRDVYDITIDSPSKWYTSFTISPENYEILKQSLK